MPQFGPRPTLGELQRTTPWIWLWCECCQHHAPLACAVAVILWGPEASSDKLRAGARCTSTTLADLFKQHVRADPFSAVRASLRRQSSDERDDSVTDSRQAWLRRRSVDSFFPISLF